MPIYEYKLKGAPCTECGTRFTDLQKMSEPAHQTCPRCQAPCERVFSTFSIGIAAVLSNDRIQKLGFTKYERREKGVFERTAGSVGPKILKSK
jgi:putative FmdB family regulatory protein